MGIAYVYFTSFSCKSCLAKEILGTSKVSGKFQITLPKEVRERFKIEEQEILVFSAEDGRLVLRKNTE